ncbi:MAG: amino acid racemase [bacterium]|nr:amino acid racemase [bacterium]
MQERSKLIGLVGGVSWTSTLEYYRRFNEQVYLAQGGYASARLLISSINFSEILAYQKSGRSDLEADFLVQELQRLEKGGAECALICSNTTNKTVETLRQSVSIPILSLPESVALDAISKGLRCVGLLGTTYTMYGTFYRECLEAHGLKVVVPNEAAGTMVHTIIYEELVKGAVLQRSAGILDEISRDLVRLGAEAIILGCTELPLLRNKMRAECAFLDTIDIHIARALEFAQVLKRTVVC